jgi:putative ABC transport system permease protein
MMLLKIALRNILRNIRRSLMTASAIAVGAVALILFGEYIAFVMVGLKTGMVQQYGHLSVFKKGYFDFGSGSPAAYSISDYRGVMTLIENDPALKPMLHVVTPTVTLYGIAGNFSIDASKTFFGAGVVPSDMDKMRHWDEPGIMKGRSYEPLGLSDNDINHGVVGVGLARVLGLCEPLKIANCPPLPKRIETAAPEISAPPADFTELAARDRVPSAPVDRAPRIDLLGATAGGAPNVVAFYINQAQSQSVKELDDAYVSMNLQLAQQLLYGRGEHKAIAIVIQLHHTADMAKARARLNALFREHGRDLEVRDFDELQPQFNLIIGYLAAIFTFIAVIMGVIVLFTIVNTMSMSVMERTNEIGTARAMGVRRSGIRRQFLVEGLLLGAIGATLGVILATLLAVWLNNMGITYLAPTQSHPVPLKLLTEGVSGLLVCIWCGLFLMAALASIIPAGRAARMVVVDALRHV